MKRILHQALNTLFRSRFSARVDALRAESRAEMARASSEGKAWDTMQRNVALLGLKTDADSRPKMLFGAGH